MSVLLPRRDGGNYFLAAFFLPAFFAAGAALPTDFFAADFVSDFFDADFAPGDFLPEDRPKAESHPAAYFSLEPTRTMDTVNNLLKIENLKRAGTRVRL